MDQKEFKLHDLEIRYAQHLGVPLPTLSPSERLRQLMATRNEWKLYRRKCDATGEEILSAYPPDAPFKVYKNSVWWGGGWDATEFGRDFDFSRPFFEQFAELQKVVPRDGTSIFNSENCEYNSHIRESRNCYLNSLIAKCEDTHYSYWVVGDKDVVDCMYTNDSTLCHTCSDVNKCYGCVLLEEANNCSDCYFSYQLRGCDHCLFSSNLADKSYYLFNKSCTKEQFEEAIAYYLNGSYARWQEAVQKFLEMKAATPHRFAHNLNCENVRGDHLNHCRNCFDSFESYESEDCVNGISMDASKNVYNAYSAGWPGCEGIYSCTVMRGCKDCAFCTYTWFSGNMRYSDSCNACDSCFGCIGLHHKKFCILNKQYTKEEYEKLLPRVLSHMKETGEWGQFFPPALSPFAYNETAAQDFFPLKKEEALARGWRWREPDKRDYQPATLQNIPDNIRDVNEGITKEILACTECCKNYKIIARELVFYRKMNLPVPRHCPTCRHEKRFKKRNPYRFFQRPCSSCHKTIESTYAPERPERVYCEGCYLKTVY
ncbi:MAG: hypothetical protein V1760_00600 [Candidatus Peregrinibacteria bacterium]